MTSSAAFLLILTPPYPHHSAIQLIGHRFFENVTYTLFADNFAITYHRDCIQIERANLSPALYTSTRAPPACTTRTPTFFQPRRTRIRPLLLGQPAVGARGLDGRSLSACTQYAVFWYVLPINKGYIFSKNGYCYSTDYKKPKTRPTAQRW